MLVAFMSKPCPRIFIPLNLYAIICLIFNKIIPITLPMKLRPQKPGKLWLSTLTLTPTNRNDSTVFVINLHDIGSVSGSQGGGEAIILGGDWRPLSGDRTGSEAWRGGPINGFLPVCVQFHLNWSCHQVCVVSNTYISIFVGEDFCYQA